MNIIKTVVHSTNVLLAENDTYNHLLRYISHNSMINSQSVPAHPYTIYYGLKDV